jgi:PQQ-dependent catabolism-associated beta-propeller protein
MAHVIDVKTQEVIANVLVDQRPRHAEFTPDGSKLWVSSEIGGTVSVIDAKSFVVEKKIEFQIPGVSKDNIQPVGIRMTRDGKTAFVALGPANRIAVVDMASLAVTQYVLVGQRVWHMALTPEDDLLFTTNGVSNDVTVVDVATLKPIKSIKVGRYPWGAAVRPTQGNTAGGKTTKIP